VLQRFTADIWPAVAGYNAHPSQGGPAYDQYLTVIDKDLNTAQWNALRTALHHLGVVHEPGETQGGSQRDSSGLRLADTWVTALDPPTTTLQVCYAFTAVTYRGDQPVRTPTASKANFELHKTDAWYLDAITGNHRAVLPQTARNTRGLPRRVAMAPPPPPLPAVGAVVVIAVTHARPAIR
jgi:hypothetical protein